MEKEYQLSWLKVVGGIILIIVIVAILCLMVPNKSKGNVLATSTYITNINTMKEAGFDYFKGSNLPEKIGETNEITLKEMIDSNLIIEFYDENGTSCDANNSYIQVTKNVDNEYAMKVSLNCDSKKDYIVTSISDNAYNIINNDDNSPSNNEIVENEDSTTNSNNSTNNNNSSTEYGNSSNNSSTINNTTNNITYINKCLENDCTNNVYYTVTFDTAGGTYVAKQVVKYGNKISYVTTYRDGYNFLGWYYNDKEFDINTPITTTMKLTAKWQKVENTTENKTFVVTFISNGGTSISSVNVINNNKIDKPANPSRNCYDFLGWYTDSSLTNRYDFNNPVTSNLTLYAKWIENDSCKAKTYNVTYVYNNGSTAKTITVNDGAYLSVPIDPVRSCYDFEGWYTNNSLTNKYGFNQPVTSDLVLYAKWIENDSCKTNTHNVTYVYNNGSTAKTITVNDGTYLSVPTDPVRSCYDFEGWYTNNSLTNKYSFNQPITSDLVLYAKWTENNSCKITHNITFIYNNGNASQTITINDGDYLSVPANPVRSGYNFVGWYNNNKVFNFNEKIYSDYVLEAVWEKVQVQYSTYCLKTNQRFYSTSYVNASETTWNYNWTIKFDKLINAKNVRLTNIGYLTDITMYNSVYNDYVRGKEISQVGSNSNYSIPITSGSMLRTYSLKPSNFEKYLSSPYYYSGYWYIDAKVGINNYYNLTKYYAPSIKREIYFVPFYFDINYTDMNNCVTDLTSLASYYRNYEIVNTFYE